MIDIRDVKVKARKIPGVKKIVVSQSRSGAEGNINYYHVKIYLDDIESLVNVAKAKEASANDGLIQPSYRILLAESDDRSSTLPEPEFPSFER